jgi:two-component system chemotaxis response regulator CheY
MKIDNLSVLVIDDVQTIRNLLKKNLNELGIKKIQETDSLLEAIKIINTGIDSNNPIDLILCDWNMPKGDGIELLEKIRADKNDQIRLTKFIMITGANDKVLMSMDKGANNIIHKPFSPEVIFQKLEIVFGKMTS